MTFAIGHKGENGAENTTEIVSSANGFLTKRMSFFFLVAFVTDDLWAMAIREIKEQD